MKPPLSYYGGKTTLAARLVALFPPHGHYVEPFAGSLAVLLAKPRSPMETVNDLDGDLMTFWRVLRDQPDDLMRVCALTPHSRAEHQLSYDLGSCSDLESARRVWVRLTQGRNGTMRRTGWRHYQKPSGSSVSMPGYLAGYVDRIPSVAGRLAGVSLEARDALTLIGVYGQHPGVLLYCDPPYLASTRGWGNNYGVEMRTAEQHSALAGALLGCKAAVVLSGYASPLYDDGLYRDWHRAELSAWTGNGIRDGRTKSDGDRVEVVWSNRPFPQADLFWDVAE